MTKELVAELEKFQINIQNKYQEYQALKSRNIDKQEFENASNLKDIMDTIETLIDKLESKTKLNITLERKSKLKVIFH